ncbi:MAG: hypothetical protein MI754_18010 [Chromatiales bacterium]|nr:hypothetical protein [Chromatiales bacterium]
MAITPLSNIALQGIQRGMQSMRKNASDIASASQTNGTIPTTDMVRSMVELHQNRQHATASVQAFKTADQMIGSLLDIKA